MAAPALSRLDCTTVKPRYKDIGYNNNLGLAIDLSYTELVHTKNNNILSITNIAIFLGSLY